MKYQVLFSLKNNEKYSRLSSAAVVIGTFRANCLQPFNISVIFIYENDKCHRFSEAEAWDIHNR